jgi:hypothetical protein
MLVPAYDGQISILREGLAYSGFKVRMEEQLQMTCEDFEPWLPSNAKK